MRGQRGNRTIMGRVDNRSRMTLTAIARELDLPLNYVVRLLELLGPYLRAFRRRTGTSMTYDAVTVDYLNQILGRAHRSTDAPSRDWLALYLKEGTHASREHPRPPPGGTAGQASGGDGD